MANRVEHDEAYPLVEDPSVGSLDRLRAGRHVSAILAGTVALVAVVGLGLVAVRSQEGAVQAPASMGFVQLDGAVTTTKKSGSEAFILDSVNGPINTIFIPQSSLEGGLNSAELAKLGDVELQKRGMIDQSGQGVPKKGEFCANPATSMNSNTACCYQILSGTTVVNEKTKDLEKFPNLALKVTIGYERLLEPSMVKYVRDMQGVTTAQRAKTADELRKNGVLDKKQLSSVPDQKQLLSSAGIEGEALTANSQSMGALQNMPDVVSAEEKAQQETLDKERADSQEAIDGEIDKAKAQRDESKADAQAMYDNAKAEADAEMQKVKGQAQADLDKTTAKLAELELGSADLQAEEADLAAQVDQKLQGAAELTKGVKLNTWQLIQRNAIFGGRFFHGGVCDTDAKVRLDVAEFTADALANLPNPSTGTQWTDANVVGGDANAWSATVVSEGYSKDYLTSMVTRSSPESSSEYSFSVSNSRDERQATRMFETYGSSASEFTKKEGGMGMSFGIPGVFSFGGGYSQTSSKSSASSQMGENDRSTRYSQTGTQLSKVEFYEEPRMVIMVPRSMLQATAYFTNFTGDAYADMTLEDATKRIFDIYGTHVCPKVTLGGRWRITARATSLTATKYASLSQAASQAISETSASGRAGQAAAAGQVNVGGVPVTGATAVGGGSGSAEMNEENSAGGDAQQGSSEIRKTSVKVQQKWTGGQSGGTPAAWRASLAEEENSNWKVLKFSFMDCVPVWAFYPAGLWKQKVAACVYWYYMEIEYSETLDLQAKEELMQEVPRKCTDDPDSTYLGPLEEAFKQAMVRESERQATVVVKMDEFEVIAPKYQGKTSCSEVVKVSNMDSVLGLLDAGECQDNTDLQGCQDLCAARENCRGFWHYDKKRCCPKQTWDFQFEKNMDSDPGAFYQCTGATNTVDTIQLTAKAQTDWGDWSSYENCHSRGFVTGIRQKLESKQGGDGDDTALNGIELKCKDGTTVDGKVGQWGEWGEWQDCATKAFMVGYTLRSYAGQGSGGGDSDDYAAIGIKGECSDGATLHADDRPDRGWSADVGAKRYARCPPGYYITSLKTLVEKNAGGADDTALNDVKMECIKEADVTIPFVGTSSGKCSKYTILDDAADCMEAASLMELSWQHEEASPYMPSGCYGWGPYDSQQFSVYFNSAPDGNPEPDKYAFAYTSFCYSVGVPFVFLFNDCAVNKGGWDIDKTTVRASSTFEECAEACEGSPGCTGFEIGGCKRSRQCQGTCKTLTEYPGDLKGSGCDQTGKVKTYVISTTPTTTLSDLYTMVGTGVVNPAKWNVSDISPGNGVEACYEAVLKDEECKGGYFMYAARLDLSCGCSIEGKLEVATGEVAKTSDYYKFTTTTTTEFQACVSVEPELTSSVMQSLCGNEKDMDEDRSPSAVGCDASYTSDVRLALANGMFKHCGAWCLYDVFEPSTKAWSWNDQEGSKCWNKLYEGGCLIHAEKDDAINKASKLCQPFPEEASALTTRSPVDDSESDSDVWEMPLAPGNQCNQLENGGAGAIEWDLRMDLAECKTHCEITSHCAALVYRGPETGKEDSGESCGIYNIDATIFSNPDGVRKETYWKCYTKKQACSTTLQNPPETDRTYSSVADGVSWAPASTQSMLDSEGAWCAQPTGGQSEEEAIGEWMQIDLGSVKFVGGVVVQGSADGSVKKITVYTSHDGSSWSPIPVTGVGNPEGPLVEGLITGALQDEKTKVKTTWQAQITARYVRFVIYESSLPCMRAAVLICEAPRYALGPTGSIDCSSDEYVPIMSDSQCKDAAKAMKLTWSSESSGEWHETRPSGCYQYVPNGKVYYNPFIGGISQGDEQRVCQKASEIPDPMIFVGQNCSSDADCGKLAQCHETGKCYETCFNTATTCATAIPRRDTYYCDYRFTGGRPSCGVVNTRCSSLDDFLCPLFWTRPLNEGYQCNDQEDSGPALLHWLYSNVSLDDCRRLCENTTDCAAIVYRPSMVDCATYNNQATIFEKPDRVRLEGGWFCYTRVTTVTTTNLAQDSCTSKCSDLLCSETWTQRLPMGEQCNDKEDSGPAVIHWVYSQTSLDECKQKCQENPDCVAIAFQAATLDCATYNSQATIFSNLSAVRLEGGWACYTKEANNGYVLVHSTASDGARWNRGPGGNSTPNGEALYTSGDYEVLLEQTLSSCQEACVCRSWCKGFSFQSGQSGTDPDFRSGACQLMSQLSATKSDIDGVESYRRIGCNPNKCDGLVCTPGTSINVRAVGGETKINYGIKNGKGTYITEDVASLKECKQMIGSTTAFEVRYAAYEKNGSVRKCHLYGRYYPKATGLHVIEPTWAWVQQREGICCQADKWNCCGRGDNNLPEGAAAAAAAALQWVQESAIAQGLTTKQILKQAMQNISTITDYEEWLDSVPDEMKEGFKNFNRYGSRLYCPKGYAQCAKGSCVKELPASCDKGEAPVVGAESCLA